MKHKIFTPLIIIVFATTTVLSYWFIAISMPQKASAAAAQDFMNTIQKGQLEDAYSMLSPDFQGHLDQPTFNKTTVDNLTGYQDSFLSFNKTKSDDDNAEYVGTFYGGSVIVKNVTVKTVKADGKWRIGAIKVTN